MPSATVVRTVELGVPSAEVWAVLADFASISRWAPNVDHSCTLSTVDSGVGAVRRIQVGRATMVERVLDWDEPSQLAYSIGGLPPVVRQVTNTWTLEPTSGGTAVSLTGRVEVGPRPPHRLVARVVARQLGRAADEMLAGLAAELGAIDGARS